MENNDYPLTVAELLDDAIVYSPATIAAVLRFKASHPWRGSLDERHEKLRALHAALAEAHGLRPSPRLIFGNDHASCSGRSCYIGFPINAIVLRGKLSVVTYLHEFAHAQGMGERDAGRWSINLFRRIWPKLYARCRHEKHMLRAPARDET